MTQRPQSRDDRQGWSSFSLLDVARLGPGEATSAAELSPAALTSGSSGSPRVFVSPVERHGFVHVYVEGEDGPTLGRTNPVRTWRLAYLVLTQGGACVWLRPPSCVWRSIALAHVELETDAANGPQCFKLDTARRTVHVRCASPADASAWMASMLKCAERHADNSLLDMTEAMLTDALDSAFGSPLAQLEMARRQVDGEASPLPHAGDVKPVVQRGAHDPNRYSLPMERALRSCVRDVRADAALFSRASDASDEARYAYIDATYGAWVHRHVGARFSRVLSFYSPLPSPAPFTSARTSTPRSSDVILRATSLTGAPGSAGIGFRHSVSAPSAQPSTPTAAARSVTSGSIAAPLTGTSLSGDGVALARRLLGLDDCAWTSKRAHARITTSLRMPNAMATPDPTSSIEEDSFRVLGEPTQLLLETAAIAGAPPEFIVRAYEVSNVACMAAASAAYAQARGVNPRARGARASLLPGRSSRSSTLKEQSGLVLYGVDVGMLSPAPASASVPRFRSKPAPVYRSATARFPPSRAAALAASSPPSMPAIRRDGEAVVASPVSMSMAAFISMPTDAAAAMPDGARPRMSMSAMSSSTGGGGSSAGGGRAPRTPVPASSSFNLGGWISSQFRGVIPQHVTDSYGPSRGAAQGDDNYDVDDDGEEAYVVVPREDAPPRAAQLQKEVSGSSLGAPGPVAAFASNGELPRVGSVTGSAVSAADVRRAAYVRYGARTSAGTRSRTSTGQEDAGLAREASSSSMVGPGGAAAAASLPRGMTEGVPGAGDR